MSKYKFLYSFCLSILGLCLLVFGLHIMTLKFLHLPLLDHMIVWAYSINALMAIAIFSFLYFFRIKLRHQIGFLFLAGSMLKFLVFFLVFYPVYNMDGKMEALEFSSFFVPYIICLFIETLFAAKMLNNLP
ncbi:MAG TPA: DUF6168 family protein [Arenibacter sp.]|nr:DUF6168 family protein [Arenibacter sp.]